MTYHNSSTTIDIKCSPDELAGVIDALRRAGLFDEVSEGAPYLPQAVVPAAVRGPRWHDSVMDRVLLTTLITAVITLSICSTWIIAKLAGWVA
ncbi:MAG: hypothetical protein LBC97_15855 [Bifidobacteriaceae bacterium]|jgi:hypothetical protein|nr:hypothetical protein [Bifidobacteriaceae bacterium]